MRFEEIFREMPFVAFLPMSGCQCTQGCHECVPLRGFMGGRRAIEAPIKLQISSAAIACGRSFLWGFATTVTGLRLIRPNQLSLVEFIQPRKISPHGKWTGILYF